MDMVEDLEEGDGGSVLEEALPLGLMLAWEEGDCRDVAISSVELQQCLPRRVILLMAALGLCHMAMPGHLWEQIPMHRR
jgi:hypothetical protein